MVHMYLNRYRRVKYVLGLLSCLTQGQNSNASMRVHRRSEFAFEVKAPFETVVPLFGAYKERLWAEGWNPQFIYPAQANDQAGAVFTTRAGHCTVWINTIYDLSKGHIQYACFATEGMATLIDIRVQRRSAATTHAVVVYERTATQPEANDYVARQGDSDAAKGPEWEAALQDYFNREASRSPKKSHD
jgi:hypothetical protein